MIDVGVWAILLECATLACRLFWVEINQSSTNSERIFSSSVIFLSKEIHIESPASGRELYHNHPRIFALAQHGEGPSRTLLARFPCAPLLLGCLARICLPLSQLPGNCLLAPLNSKIPPLLSLSSKMTFIPNFASSSFHAYVNSLCVRVTIWVSFVNLLYVILINYPTRIKGVRRNISLHRHWICDL